MSDREDRIRRLTKKYEEDDAAGARAAREHELRVEEARTAEMHGLAVNEARLKEQYSGACQALDYFHSWLLANTVKPFGGFLIRRRWAVIRTSGGAPLLTLGRNGDAQIIVHEKVTDEHPAHGASDQPTAFKGVKYSYGPLTPRTLKKLGNDPVGAIEKAIARTIASSK